MSSDRQCSILGKLYQAWQGFRNDPETESTRRDSMMGPHIKPMAQEATKVVADRMYHRWFVRLQVARKMLRGWEHKYSCRSPSFNSQHQVELCEPRQGALLAWHQNIKTWKDWAIFKNLIMIPFQRLCWRFNLEKILSKKEFLFTKKSLAPKPLFQMSTLLCLMFVN